MNPKPGKSSTAGVALTLGAFGLVTIILAAPSRAQTPVAHPGDGCAQQLDVIETALAAEGPRRVLFADHLALLRESHRRGEERLCLDMSEDLLDELLVFDA